MPRILPPEIRSAIRRQWRKQPDQSCIDVVEVLAARGITITIHNAKNHRPVGLLPPERLAVKGSKSHYITAPEPIISDVKRDAIRQAWAANPHATLIEIDLWLRKRGVKICRDSIISYFRPHDSPAWVAGEELEILAIDNRLTTDPTPEKIEEWKRKYFREKFPSLS